MMNIFQLVLAIAAGSIIVFGTIAIWALMGFYSVRILRSFRGGVLSKGWKYICIAVPFLIFGQVSTGIGGSDSLAIMEQAAFKVLGTSLSAIGGLMIVIGFRIQYKAWNPKELKIAPSQAKTA
jgi:hypothetical protein